MAHDDATPRLLGRFLHKTFHHYSAIIPDRFPWLTRAILRWMFGRSEVSEKSRAKLKRLAEQGTILYALPDVRRLEALLLSVRLRQLGLPAPMFAHYVSLYMVQPVTTTLRRFASVAVSLLTRRKYPSPYRDGFVHDLVAGGVPSCVFLRQFRGLPRRFAREHIDPLAAIVQSANELDRRLYVVPVFVLLSRKPPRESTTVSDMVFGSQTQPGRLRFLLAFLRYRKNAVVRLGKTIDVDKFVEDEGPKVEYSTDRMSQIAYRLRAEGLRRIGEEQRVSLGPPRKYRSEIIEAALQDPETRRGIHEYTAAQGLGYGTGRKLVRAYLEEIAADLNITAIKFLDRMLTWFLNRSYAGLVVDEEGVHRLRKIARHTPVIYVPCHKSHMDYLLVSYVLYHRHMSVPYIAAGVNLSFWPLGPIFRNSGAFFLRRSFKGAPLYPLAFAKYVEVLLREGYNLEFFIEGGRSRTGKLGVPKLGFLSIVLDAARKAELADLTFVPVMINYERVLEDAYYFREQSGEANPPENLKSILEARGVLGRKQGKVYVDFGEFVSLRRFLKDRDLAELPADRGESTALAADLSRMFVYEMNRASKVPPYAVVAAAVLSTEKRGIYMDQVRRRVGMLAGYLRAREIQFTENVGSDTIWPDPVLTVMESEGYLRADHGERGDPTLYFVKEENRLNLTFYKNAIVHHFQFPAMLAVSFLREGSASAESLYEDYEKLRRILRREFVYGRDVDESNEPQRREFDDALNYMIEAGYVERLDGRVIVVEQGNEAVPLLASMVMPLLESYYLAMKTVGTMGPDPVPEKDIHRLALKRADRLFSTGEITRKESKNKLIFESALGLLQDEGVLDADVRPIKRGKKFERTYILKDRERLEKIIADLAFFLLPPT